MEAEFLIHCWTKPVVVVGFVPGVGLVMSLGVGPRDIRLCMN